MKRFIQRHIQQLCLFTVIVLSCSSFLKLNVYAEEYTLNALSNPTMYTYEMLQQDIITLCRKYPNTLHYSSLGITAQGRDIYQIIWGNPTAEHAIFLDASIHAREYVNTQLVIAMLDFYGALDLQNICFYIIPMVNPDGVTMSQTGNMGLTTDQLVWINAAFQVERRKSMSVEEFVRRWKANANGVDINRSFPAGWENTRQKGYPTSEGFKGIIPASEAETQALMKAVNQRSFELAINYHSMGNVLYYGTGDARADLNGKAAELADYVARITGYRIISSENSKGGGGTFANYLMTTVEIPSVTIESGACSCPDNAKEFSEIYQRNIWVWSQLILYFGG